MSRIQALLIQIGLIVLTGVAYADPVHNQAHNPIVRSPVSSVVSHPLRHATELPDVVHDVRKLERKMLPNRLGSGDSPEADGVQDTGVGPSVATTEASFEGLGNRNGVLPPDTVGAIGPNHYVQMTNLSFEVFNRNGTVAFGPVNNNTLWGSLGGNCAGNNDGDPIVLYDEAADRWLVSQFALPSLTTGPFYQCIAVSQTPDPTGGWNLYEYKISDNKLNDYPKFGVWSDGYYLSVNQFNKANFSWAGAGVAVFERDKMLAGDSNPRMVYFDLYSTNPNLGGFLPSDWDGQMPPPAGDPNVFIQMDDNAWGYSPDQLQLWNFHVDWSNPTNTTFSHDRNLSVAAFDSNLCGYARNCIPQPGGTKVDSLADRLMFRLQYRNFGDHQTLVTNHSVDVNGNDHAGVRWYELRNSGGGWSVYQQGTYAPDSDHRWLGSVAMNGAGDIGLGYSVSSTSTYPSIRYTGRLNGDLPNQMTQGEGSIVAGNGYQTHSSGRWGDYSALTVDPIDDCTFWYTQEYYATVSNAGWRTRIGAFKLADCGAVDNPPSVTLTNPTEGATVDSTVIVTANVSEDGSVAQVEFQVDGSTIGTDTDGTDGWSSSWDTTATTDGPHTVSAIATDNANQLGSDSNSVIVDNQPDPTMNVADLDGLSTAGKQGTWTADVTITIRDTGDAAVNGATVTGSWGDGANGSGGCTTVSSGQCTVSKANLKNNVASVSFTVTDVSATNYVYVSDNNADPDGDSDGTMILVCKDGCGEPPPPPSGVKAHIGDLEGSTLAGRGSKWDVTVRVIVHDADEINATGVTVTGGWSGAASGGASCTTDNNGTCDVSEANLRGSDATFTVSDILDSAGASIYDPTANEVGDSITVNQP